MKQNRIYIVSFFEGAAVMATELCGSKLLSPYFGSSLYVWASVIALTLGSLALGYFYGGRLSIKENKTRLLSAILVIAAVYMGCMPLVSSLFGAIAIYLSLIPAVIVSSALLLIVPLFLMGAASPLVISIQAQQAQDSGRVSGLVYSVSTFGGIIATFLCGFFFIPGFGVPISLIIFAALLALSLLLLPGKKKIYNLGLALIVILLPAFTWHLPAKNCIYEKDGMLGRLNVIDDTLQEGRIIRKLLINSVVQSEMDLKTGKSVSEYIKILNENIHITKQPFNALVLGLGGGLAANLLEEKGYSVTGVELDERIIYSAKTFFSLSPKVNTVCDDARHFLNISHEKYQVILVDLFKAEEQPAHVITMESLEQIKTLLDINGGLVINWHGYSSGERGMGTAILLNTLSKSGFKFRIASNSEIEDQRNLIIFASPNPVNELISEVSLSLPPTNIINSDSRPVLEKYNALANQSWRRNYILYYYSKN